MGHAAATASSAIAASPHTTKQTRVMSAWWSATMRAKAVSSPRTARSTSPSRDSWTPTAGMLTKDEIVTLPVKPGSAAQPQP